MSNETDLAEQLQSALETDGPNADVLEPSDTPQQSYQPEPEVSGEGTEYQPEGVSTEHGDPEPGESVSTAYLEKLKQRGIDLTGQYKSDDDVIDAFVNQRELIGRQSEFVNLGRALKENPQAVISRYAQHFGYVPQQQQQYQPQSQAQPASQEPDQPVTVETLGEWNRAVVRDDEGNIVSVKPGHDPQVALKLHKYEQRALKTQQEFLLDPDQFIMQRAAAAAPRQEQIRDLIAREIEQRNEVSREESKATDFFQEHKDWLIDPATGQLSGNGREFYNFMREGMEVGIPERNTDGLVQYAVKSLQAKYRGSAAPQPRTRPAAGRQSVSSLPPVKNEGEYNQGEDLEAALLRNLRLS